jgi:tetratricopeptide (TPR) repeat protein
MSRTCRKPLTLFAAALLLTLYWHRAGAMEQTSMAAEISHIEHEWARIVFQVSNSDEQDREMRALCDAAARVVARYPGRAEPLVWDGIVTSSEAQYAGTFSALGYAKDARALFEKAGRIDYRAVNGAVPTSLGALYYLVPGFPFGFGDDSVARQYLEQGVQISPNGLDANFFYGDFLFRQGEYSKAAAALRHALAAPHDPERPIWDAGRRGQIRTLLAKVEQKLASNR